MKTIITLMLALCLAMPSTAAFAGKKRMGAAMAAGIGGLMLKEFARQTRNKGCNKASCKSRVKATNGKKRQTTTRSADRSANKTRGVTARDTKASGAGHTLIKAPGAAPSRHTAPVRQGL